MGRVGRAVESAPEGVPEQQRRHPAPVQVTAAEVNARLGPGASPSAGERATIKAAVHHDLAELRIHTGPRARYLARVLGADAFTVGRHIVLAQVGAADRSRRQDLLVHEARHVAAGHLGLQRAVTVDDVADEMVGQAFYLLSAQGSGASQLPVGTRVIVTAWNGTGPNAGITTTRMGVATTLTVPKLALDPEVRGASGVREYRVGLAGQRTAVEGRQDAVLEQDTKLSDWRAKEASYASNHKKWEDGLDRLTKEMERRTALLSKSESTMSRMLVRETMYNRFDSEIVRWVDHYNTQLNPATKLDPNVVKSVFFQESRMGTSGRHLETGPYTWTLSLKFPHRSRHNIGQAIDSVVSQQLVMMKEMAPSIYLAHHLDELDVERKKVQMSEDDMFRWRGGEFHAAMKEFFTFRDAAGANAMGHAGHDLHEEYAFWIRTSVRWLFSKYFSLPAASRTWPEAVRAYNGGGSAARAYRDAVMARAGSSKDLNVGNQ